jgi:hypothetical protein
MAEVDPADLLVDAGATFRRIFAWVEADGTTPVSMAGYETRLQIRPRVGDDTVLLSIDSAAPSGSSSLLVEPEGAAGEVHLKIGATVTAALTKGVYGLELYMPADPNEVERLAQGKVSVSKEVAT